MHFLNISTILYTESEHLGICILVLQSCNNCSKQQQVLLLSSPIFLIKKKYKMENEVLRFGNSEKPNPYCLQKQVFYLNI